MRSGIDLVLKPAGQVPFIDVYAEAVCFSLVYMTLD